MIYLLDYNQYCTLWCHSYHQLSFSFPFWAGKLTDTFTLRCTGSLTASFSSLSESICDSKPSYYGRQRHPFPSLSVNSAENLVFCAILIWKMTKFAHEVSITIHSIQLILGIPTPYKTRPPIGSMSRRHIIILEVTLEWLTGSWEHRSVCKQNTHVSGRYTGHQGMWTFM